MDNIQAKRWHTTEALDLRELWLFMHGEGKFMLMDQEILEKTVIFLTDGTLSCVIALKELQLPAEADEPDTTMLRQFVDLLERFESQRTLIEDDALETASEEEANDENVPARISEEIRNLGEAGLLSSAEQRRLKRLAEDAKTLPDPFGSDKTIGEIAAEEVEIKPIPTDVPSPIKKAANPNIGVSTVSNMDKYYLENYYEKNLVDSVMKMGDAGYIVKEFTKQEVRTVKDNYEEFTVKIQPISGKASTFKFRIPKLQENGTYLAGGSRYNVECQRVDMPIRKNGPDSCVLTSYYGKAFITRSPKAVDNYSRWVIRHLTAAGLDTENKQVTSMQFGKSPKIKGEVPLLYSSIADKIAKFNSNGVKFDFNYHEREETFGKETVRKVEKDGRVICGKKVTDSVVIDENNLLWAVPLEGQERYLGRIEDFVLQKGPAPIDHATITVFGKKVPVIVALCYMLGIEKAFKRLNLNIRTEATGARLELKEWEYPIVFKDETFVVDIRDRLTSMLIAGFRPVKDIIKMYRIDQFNKKSGYVAFGEKLKVSSYHWREIDLMNDMFIDPITEDLLKGMGEPTNFIDLVLRATQLVLDNNYPDETDTLEQRIRGLERITGMVYSNLVAGMRSHRNNPVARNATVDINPYAVYMTILNDTATQIVNDINPVENLKEKEAVSLSGEGGRAAVSLVKKSRVYHPNDVGVISEATPDSSKVAIRTFLTPNANLNSIYGTVRKLDKEDGTNKLISTTAQLIPGANHDD